MSFVIAQVNNPIPAKDIDTGALLPISAVKDKDGHGVLRVVDVSSKAYSEIEDRIKTFSVSTGQYTEQLGTVEIISVAPGETATIYNFENITKEKCMLYVAYYGNSQGADRFELEVKWHFATTYGSNNAIVQKPTITKDTARDYHTDKFDVLSPKLEIRLKNLHTENTIPFQVVVIGYGSQRSA